MSSEASSSDCETLIAFLRRVPAIAASGGVISSGRSETGRWWVKFTIKLEHPLAWRTVQELGHVLNYISLNERLPTVFMPVSPPPYLNGGAEFLAWVIEAKAQEFTPDLAAELLEGRMPRPVDDLAQWAMDNTD